MTQSKIPSSLQKLRTVLKRELGAKVEFEKVSKLSRYRIAVVSPKFDRVPHMRRQDRIWKLVDQTLKPADSLKISLILAFAPKELGLSRKSRRAKVA